MKRLAILVCCALLGALPIASAGSRTLSDTFPMEDVDRIDVQVGVGDFILTADETDVARVDVRLTPRRGGIFSSMKRGERDVAAAVLSSEVVGQTLYLRVESTSDDPRFEERWTVQVPARLALDLDLGVGEVTIDGVGGGVTMELGVVDAIVEVSGGDVFLDLGVGDATVRGPADSYGSVEAEDGLGNARLTIRGEAVDGTGFIGDSAMWRGEGPHTIEVQVGVGDAMIKLD